jgi:hypothetical protein
MCPDDLLALEFDPVDMAPLGNSWDEDVGRLMVNVVPLFKLIGQSYPLADLVFLLFIRPGGTFNFKIVVLGDGVRDGIVGRVSTMVRLLGASGYVFVIGDREGQTLALYSGLERSRRAMMHMQDGTLHELATDESSALPFFNLGGVEELCYTCGHADG